MLRPQATTTGPRAAYRALLAAGTIVPDPAQAEAVDALQQLHDALAGHKAAAPAQPAAGLGRWIARLVGEPAPVPTAPRGLYIHGDVGRGKSMLMDLFFAQVPVAAKRRVHFHAFMLEVHRTVHGWRKAARDGGRAIDDPIPPLADKIAAQTTLLCFDEFHVTDIADAMILSRLFTALFERGLVMVATSNWPPELLYEHGLQRESFLPFIDLVRARCEIIELKAAKDYRLARMIGQPVYFVPLGAAADRALADAFARLTDDAAGEPVTLTVDGRPLPVACHAKGAARVDYDLLCRQPRGASDFIALCETFHALVLSGVPRLPADRADETKRFMLLIDTLYEHRTKLVMAADAPPQDLYRGKTLAFEFKRTASRLNEMQSAEYWSERTI
ncbi:MAG: cell division protein ZapE [Alphaproteobacteria bacterium]